MSQKKEKKEQQKVSPEQLRQIFDDYDARANFVGAFDLLYRIDRRLEPERYEDGAELP